MLNLYNIMLLWNSTLESNFFFLLLYTIIYGTCIKINARLHLLTIELLNRMVLFYMYDYTIVHIYICVVSEFICLKFDENKTVLDSHFPELKAVRLIQVSSIHVVQMICLKIFIYEIELKMENVSSDNNINPNSRKQPKATNGSSTHWENTTPRGIFSWPQDNNVY